MASPADPGRMCGGRDERRSAGRKGQATSVRSFDYRSATVAAVRILAAMMLFASALLAGGCIAFSARSTGTTGPDPSRNPGKSVEASSAAPGSRSYTIDAADIKADVDSAGDMRVKETRTFDFNGRFTRVYWDLRTAGSQGIEIVGVKGGTGMPYVLLDDPSKARSRPAGTYLVTRTPGNVNVQVFLNGTGKQTVDLEYTVRAAAKRWSDVAELYWQFIGDGWGVPTRRASATISLPSRTAPAEILAWGHGQLDGHVKTSTGAVSMEVTDLAPNAALEARVLFPASALSRAPISGSNRRQRAIAEEGGAP